MPSSAQEDRRRCGFINLLKPPGITSQQAVSRVRRLAGTKAGHAGTLDPAAAGVLVICLGGATRLASFAAGSPKAYRAEFTFGLATDTLDAQGQVTARADAGELEQEAVLGVLPQFLGEIEQTPPAFSAVQVGGKRLYHLARSGRQVSAPPRKVEVHGIELLSFRPGQTATAMLDIRCGKGTYVRSLCADIGRSLGLPAYVSFLLRTQVGSFGISDSLTLEEVAQAEEDDTLDSLIIPPDAPLQHLPAAILGADEARLITAGASVNWQGQPAGAVRVYDRQGNLIAVAKASEGGRLRPTLVLAHRE